MTNAPRRINLDTAYAFKSLRRTNAHFQKLRIFSNEPDFADTLKAYAASTKLKLPNYDDVRGVNWKWIAKNWHSNPDLNNEAVRAEHLNRFSFFQYGKALENEA